MKDIRDISVGGGRVIKREVEEHGPVSVDSCHFVVKVCQEYGPVSLTPDGLPTQVWNILKERCQVAGFNMMQTLDLLWNNGAPGFPASVFGSYPEPEAPAPGPVQSQLPSLEAAERLVQAGMEERARRYRPKIN